MILDCDHINEMQLTKKINQIIYQWIRRRDHCHLRLALSPWFPHFPPLAESVAQTPANMDALLSPAPANEKAYVRNKKRKIKFEIASEQHSKRVRVKILPQLQNSEWAMCQCLLSDSIVWYTWRQARHSLLSTDLSYDPEAFFAIPTENNNDGDILIFNA